MNEERIYASNTGTVTVERKNNMWFIGIRRGNSPFRKPEIKIELTEFQRRNLVGFYRGFKMMGTAKKNAIIEAAIMLAQQFNYKDISRAEIAALARVKAESLVSFHFGDMDEVRNMIMQQAVDRRILSIVAQGLLDKHPVAMDAPRELKRSALDVLMEGS
jgi:hypothetical protein